VIGYVSSPQLVQHDTGPHHPERPERLMAIYRALQQAELLPSVDPFPHWKFDTGARPQNRPRLRPFNPSPADEQWVLLAHTAQHLEYVKRFCGAGGGVIDQGDTFVGPNGHEMGLLSLGCALRATDAVLRGEARRCFAAGRPPGHHAEPDKAMGFCLYANAAIAARYAQRQYGLKRVAIVDFDVHHGNGTQACLEDDSSVLFISLHQHPRTCYPGSGHEWEIGAGAGRGYTMNIPLDPGSGDVEYLKVLDARVVPELEEFSPELLILSAGFDAHAEDPLAQMRVTDEGFELITRTLAATADAYCGGKIVSLLEGGYNLAALGRSVVRHVVGLA
jgi:acetoin utilization deacetylase AcuC-like enzyme